VDSRRRPDLGLSDRGLFFADLVDHATDQPDLSFTASASIQWKKVAFPDLVDQAPTAEPCLSRRRSISAELVDHAADDRTLPWPRGAREMINRPITKSRLSGCPRNADRSIWLSSDERE
jgi:hypothetical protein